MTGERQVTHHAWQAGAPIQKTLKRQLRIPTPPPGAHQICQLLLLQLLPTALGLLTRGPLTTADTKTLDGLSCCASPLLAMLPAHCCLLVCLQGRRSKQCNAMSDKPGMHLARQPSYEQRFRLRLCTAVLLCSVLPACTDCSKILGRTCSPTPALARTVHC